jgi:transcriptional regulator with XRE-family HTH domain
VTSHSLLTGSFMAEAFGVVLEGARTRRDLSRDHVALRAGVNAKEVGLLERGVREPGLSKFIDLATAIRVSPLWLLEEAIAWRAANDPAVEAEWAHARQARMRVIGTALASAVLACSDSELAVPAVVGEQFVDQLARHGLMVTAMPTDPPQPPEPS